MPNSLQQNLEILDSLAKRLVKSNLLDQMHEMVCESLNFKLTYGAEIEFYLLPRNNTNTEILHYINEDVIKEKGVNQFEIALSPVDQPLNLAKDICTTKEQLIQHYLAQDIDISFASKPQKGDYGSALHIHLNVGEDNLDQVADYLCYFLPSTFLSVAPNAESYLRFDSQFMAPTHISYGNNNRSCAVRTPSTLPKRLEYRVAGAECDPYLLLFTLLNSILKGSEITSKISKQTKIFGNAFDEQYNLLPLPKDISEANSLFDVSFFIV